jgi:hypothetical protein
MKKKFTKRNILIGIIALLLLIQLFRIDKTTKPVDPQKDFISVTQPNDEVAALLKIACYDCHSNQPSYPWYTNIAPVSWWIKHHINEGQHELNFSEWASYSDKKKDHKLEECIEMVEEGEMPLASYTRMHQEAKLTDAQKLKLVEFFRAVRNSMEHR